MMTQDDRKAIDGLFARLSQAAANAPARDPEAEALIAEKMSAQPGSAYYLAQTVIVQEQALAHVQQRIEALEAELAEARNAPQQSGGLFGSLFGSRPAPRRTTPQRPMPTQPMAPQGGGFLAGAAQTAMGVAGGMLIASAIGSMFADDAAAAEADPAAEDEDMLGGFDEGLDTEF